MPDDVAPPPINSRDPLVGAWNSSAPILDAISGVRADVSNLRNDFNAFRTALPDSFMPRREAEGLFREMHNIIAELRTRATAMDEWRLSETQRAAAREQALQSQIQAAVITALRENTTTQTTAQQQTSDARLEQMKQMYDIFRNILFLVGGAVVSGVVSLIVFLVTR